MQKYKILNNVLNNPCESCKKQEGDESNYGVLCDDCLNKLIKANFDKIDMDKHEINIDDIEIKNNNEDDNEEFEW